MPKFECDYCYQSFTRKINLKQHQKHRPPQCLRAEQMATMKINIEIQKELDKKEAEWKKKDEHNMKVQEQLINSKPTIRERKKIVENNKAQLNKIPKFETVIFNADIKPETLRECMRSGAEGDAILFKQYYLDGIPKDQRCIRPSDISRDKYQYFDGKEWCTTSLLYIVDMVADQLWRVYAPLIKEKNDVLDKVDKKFPPWVDKAKNMVEYDKICDQYTDESFHNSKLLCLPDEFKYDLRDRIRMMLLTY